MPTRVLVVPGSLRRDSFAKKLARAAGALVAGHGGEATVVDLADFAMPLYDGDLEEREGLPEAAVRLRQLVQQHDALLVVSPEYNASIPAVLKNALDWVSRPHAPEPGVSAFRGKVAAVMSSSPGALGGLRGLVHLRQILMNLGLLVISEQYALGGAASAFTQDGGLAEERSTKSVAAVVGALVEVAGKLRRPL
ncbi:MAG: NAD(P)H-dependent oxidoreductase [Planctomycetes bacterium]|nr:NAD(P)H-dependent oxidoreductase [Planctomycetota bacterium]